mmetsp:Transcript_30111/g.41410  ORF Transcript_30111/g.41410 Transcript_30111/m.41410 type:complete len:213 (+) Transcript_30111:149-787(+)
MSSMSSDCEILDFDIDVDFFFLCEELAAPDVDDDAVAPPTPGIETTNLSSSSSPCADCTVKRFTNSNKNGAHGNGSFGTVISVADIIPCELCGSRHFTGTFSVDIAVSSFSRMLEFSNLDATLLPINSVDEASHSLNAPAQSFNQMPLFTLTVPIEAYITTAVEGKRLLSNPRGSLRRKSFLGIKSTRRLTEATGNQPPQEAVPINMALPMF